jgi:hypothetical protein
MAATTRLESTPPLKKAPTGTSLRSRIFTASVRSSPKRSGTSAGRRSPAGAGTSQYFRMVTLRGVQTREWPAGSFRTSLKIEAGEGM